jgi:DNA-binding transcriptional LysR family regulator
LRWRSWTSRDCGFSACGFRGKAELGAGFEIGDEPGIDIVASHIERVAVVVAPHHPLSRESEIDMARLADFPLATSERNSGIMRVLRRLAQRQGIELEPSLVSNSLHALMRIAESGVGVALASGLSTRERVRDGKIVLVPLRGEPAPRLTLNVCVLQDRQRSFALTRMIEEVQAVMRELPVI